MKYCFVFLLFLPLAAIAAEPPPELLVQAPRLLEESIEASRSVNIIDEKEIRRKNPQTVADVLRDLPGVEVVRQGAAGQTTSVFIRGARSEDTLVLIDGAAANDAISPACGFDFSSLSPENIERIEVYRGPQSVRFGGGALGGVINIVTKEGSGPTHGAYFAEGGTFDTARAAGGLWGRSGAMAYSASADGLRTHGYSAAAKQYGNTESDGAEVGSASAKITWIPDELSKINATFRYAAVHADLDRHGGVGGDDPNDTSKSSQFLTGLEGNRRFWSEQLKSSLGFYYSEVNRADANLPDPVNATNASDSFLSENKKIESNHEFTLTDHHLLRLNLQWQSETGRASSAYNGVGSSVPRVDQSDFGQGLTYLYESPTWFGDAGLRLDEHSNIGHIPSERASIGRNFEATKTRVSLTYGTGFKAPSLYEIFSIYGTRNLRGETSDTEEFTVEQQLGSDVNASLAYFQNKYREMIDFDLTTSRYLNISSARSRGGEAQLSARLLTDYKLEVNYTYLEAVDLSTGLNLVRRPRHNANFFLRYQHGALEAFAQAHAEGARPDLDPVTFARIEDSPYVVYNAGAAYAFFPQLKVHARFENLFNRQYEEVAGYGTPGFSFFMGLSGEI